MRNSLTLALVLASGPAVADPTAADLALPLEMKISPENQIENMCGSTVTATVTPIDFGGDLGTAWLLLIPGGDDTPACYGDFPGDMYLMAAKDEGYVMIFAGGGFITVLPTDHGGVRDFALGGPGFSFPVYGWNGKEFTATNEISDIELAAMGDLPAYP